MTTLQSGPSSPSVAFPSVERDLKALSLSGSPSNVRTPDASPLRVPMPRSGSKVVRSPVTTPSRQGPPTRTMAILMRSAAKVHRLAIESRIIEAGFDIVAERAEHWYTPEDDDFLTEFLAQDPHRGTSGSTFDKWVPKLTNGSIYVLVLERNNAAQTWRDLLGPESDDPNGDGAPDSDPLEIGDDGLPVVKTGLRKTYGADAFYGSADDEAAEFQISICFPELSRYHAGSDADYGGVRTGSPNEDIQARRVLRDSDASLNARPHLPSNASKVSSERSNSDAGKEFRARPVPSSLRKASIQPRLSKAAALRMGVELPDAPRRRASEDSPRQFEGPVGISGLPRADVPIPASLRPPTVAPRLNKVAAARTQQEQGAPGSAAARVRERKEVDYSNTPGHKRKSVISVPSTAPPAIAPRQTRASMGRLSVAGGATSSPSPAPGSVRREDTGTPSSRRASSVTSMSSSGAGSLQERERKPVDYTNTPGHKRMSLNFHIPSLAAPTVAPRVNRASLARTGSGGQERPASSLASHTAASTKTDGKTSDKPRTDAADLYANTPGHRRKSMTFHVASLQAPSIVPRLNNAAEARIQAGGVAPGAASGSRPGSSMAARSSSRLGQAQGPHQDSPVPRVRPSTAGAGRAPPSSFKTPIK